MEHLQRVWHADRGAYSLGHLVSSLFGLAYVLLVDTNPFPELVFFSDYSLHLGTFSIFENDDVERILSCGFTVLCYTLEYIYIVQIAKRRPSTVLAFNMQNTIKHSTWSGICTWKQTQDFSISLLFVQFSYTSTWLHVPSGTNDPQ